MGILDDALDGVDEVERRNRARAKEQRDAQERSRAALDRMAADFARIAKESRFPTRKVYGSGRRGRHGWDVVVGGKEGDNHGYIVYPDGSWTGGWVVLHQPLNMFRRKISRLEVQRESFAPSYPVAELIEQQFAEAVRSYAARGTHR